ncbi:cation channel domain-containing protein, putative [Eimeria brunetti]|uniref:Cation channel domain-containing protein, putative n=1 Tax=Eimeria brunetti TaxID=51314 RepID=U6LFI6_9EIME|nr:cation channel domain-containing protein, putative [Eimeria brunetti]
MEARSRPFDGGMLGSALNGRSQQTNSYATQETERTDARLSSCRSRAMSSFISTSSVAAMGTVELATARGPWALFCFKVRSSRLARALLISAVIADCIGSSLEATNVTSPALFWGTRSPVFFGFLCLVVTDLPLPLEVQASDSCSADSFFWDLDEAQPLFCSNHISPCKDSTQCRNIFVHSVTSSCTTQERQRLQNRAWQDLRMNEQAGYGIFGVQTLSAAAVVLLQGFTQEGWSATMQSLANGDHRSHGIVAYVTFPALVIIGGMLLINLGIAVLWEAFDAANAVSLARPAILKESEWRVYQLLGTDWLKYLMVELNQIKDGLTHSAYFAETDDTAGDGSECASTFNNAFSSYAYMAKCWLKKAVEIRFPEQKQRLNSLYKHIRSFAFRLATHRAASPMMMIVVIIDMVVLFAQTGRSTCVAVSILDLITSTVFVVESIVLLLAFGRRGMKNGFIFLDVLLGALAFVDGVLALAVCPSISDCRASAVEADGFWGALAVISAFLRPFRVFKVVKYFCSLRMTAEMVWSLHNSLMPYVMLLLYSCVVVSQLSLFLFFDPKYSSARPSGTTLNLTKYYNFEDAISALLLFFTILTGESWHLFLKELLHVYREDTEDATFDSNQLSDYILSSRSRVATINTFLFVCLLFLNLLLFNLYGAILISRFIQTQKSLSVKYAAKFIVTCRNAGVSMPAEDALQGANAQALYTQTNMRTEDQRDELIKAITTGSDRQKSAKALGEFARKTSVVVDICKTVARRSSRRGTRTSSGSFSWGRERSSSNTNSTISTAGEKPQKKELMGDTAFDKAAAERGLALDKVARKTKQESSGLLKNGNEDGSSTTHRAGERNGLQILDFSGNGVKLGASSKAAVKFAADDSAAVLPDAAPVSQNYLAASPDGLEEDLSVAELGSMCWRAIREAFNQGRVLLTTTIAAGLARFTPMDPDSPLLHLAYASHLVSADCDVNIHSSAGSTGHRERGVPKSKEVHSIAELKSKSGSNVSASFRTRDNEANARRQEFQRLPAFIVFIITKCSAVVAYLREVCGITGMDWLKLVVQLASMIELIVDCSLKRHTSLNRVFGCSELGFQSILTADILIRFIVGKKARFFCSCFNCLDIIFQTAGWSLLAGALSVSSNEVNEVMVQSAYFRFAQCTRVARCIWLLRLFKGTGMHRLGRAMQVALRRIFRLCLIFLLLVIFFVLNLRFFLQPVAGVPPEIPLARANLTSLGESFLSVFILTTSEGWPGIMKDFLDLGGTYPYITIILCILVVALLSVFVVNVFVGIIVDVLDQEQANLEYTGGVRSATVLRWNEMQRAIFTSNLINEMVEHRYGDKRGGVLYSEGLDAREWLRRIITSKQFDLAVAVISTLSCLTMLAAGAWAETDIAWSFPSYQEWIFWINAAVVLLYVVEQCNRYGLSPLEWVALFLFIGIFVYGLFGTCLYYDAIVGVDQHFSFESLAESFLLLLSFSTGEIWHDTTLKIRAFYYERNRAVLGWSILPYAISFVAVAFLLLMNLFTSTVLKGYVDAKRNQSLWRVAQQQQDLLNKWKLREMKLSWLPIHVAVQVLAEVPPPIGFKDLYIDLGPRRMQAILANLAIYPLPVHENSVHIRDMVLTTTCRACEAHAQRRGTLAAFDPSQSQQKVELNSRFVNAWMSRFSDVTVTPEFDILQYLAAVQIQAFWRTQRLLQRNSVPDQLRYMKHLLFLLETSGPICARRRSRNDGRRSTLRRKRGTKTGGSFIHKTSMLNPLGTFKLNPKSRHRLKGFLKRMACGLLTKRQGRGQTDSAIPAQIQRPSTSYDDRLAQDEQRQRQKLLLHRSEASECITDLIEVGKEGIKEQRHQRHEVDSLRLESQEISGPFKGSATIVAGTQLDLSTDTAMASTGTRLSVASAVRIPLRVTDAVNSSAEELYRAVEPRTPAAPRRSSMRAPPPFVPPQQPRRSLRIIPVAPKSQPMPTSNADQAADIDPPRRKGQSVQFTGVQKVELQRLLAPALDQHGNSDSENDEESSS